MSQVTKSMRCGSCQAFLEEALDPSSTLHNPCPHCGSQARVFALTVADAATAYEKLRMRAKEHGARKPHLEIVHGQDFHRDTEKWNLLERVIDRRHDRYVERITDQATGSVLRLCDEPLSKHLGHGSAKKKAVAPKVSEAHGDPS